jgi:hypothetical protein
VQPARDHQVQHQPKLIFKPEHDALAQSPQRNDPAALDALNRRHDRAQQERTGDA